MKTPLRKLSGQGQARNNFLALGVSRALGHSAMHIGRCCSSACRQGAALPQRGPGVSQRSLGQRCWGVASAARGRGIAQTAGAGHLLQRNILPLARVPGIRMRAAANSMQDIRHRYCHYDVFFCRASVYLDSRDGRFAKNISSLGITRDLSTRMNPDLLQHRALSVTSSAPLSCTTSG